MFSLPILWMYIHSGAEEGRGVDEGRGSPGEGDYDPLEACLILARGSVRYDTIKLADNGSRASVASKE